MASSETGQIRVIWRPVFLLPREARRILVEAADADSDRRYGIWRPSLLVGGTVALFALLFLGGSGLTASNIFITETVPATPLRVLLLLIAGCIGILFFFFAIRILAKRLGHSRYYLYLGDEWLVERNLWHVSIIPASDLVYAWGRREFRTRGADLEYESLVWRDGNGSLKVYDLHDHYWHGAGHGRQVASSWNLIRKQYRIGGPPAGFGAGKMHRKET
ncbi:MAG TPA: hypothetical protein PLM00_07885 [Spirochaetota bacterium]|nr:hypothetical protein [Spirochaetota bacterium]HPH02094.1 hypothetical protein [Spirochaetota bacterium]HPN83298.1 hypothetical protein [Spirochaetota bacterium]